MDFYRAAQQSGFQPLLGEALGATAASMAPFANAPAGTCMVSWTHIGGTLTMRFDGGTVTATTGLNFGANNASDPYTLPLSQANCKNVRAIGDGSITSGWIVYWGI